MPEVIINGPEGRLEGRYSHARTPNAPVALLLHPHPQHGGTMNNKIVYNLYQAFVRRGFSSLRFNFRGVGRSQGTYDRGEGELSDAAAALDWLQTYNPNAPSCWVIGFSFGSVSPPANMFDFSFLAPCPSSGLIVHGDQDTLVPEEAVLKLANKLNSQRDITVTLKSIRGADHFYKDKVEQLVELVDRYVDEAIASAPARAAAGTR